MFAQNLKTHNARFITLFSVGFCLVLLTVWVPIAVKLQTFMLFWRVETAASIFLTLTLAVLLYKFSSKELRLSISRQEFRFIIIPILLFIFWSTLSMFWATSWKAAAYHTLIWVEYLIFYLVIRHLITIEDGFKTLIKFTCGVFVLMMIPAIIEYCWFLVYGGATTLGIRFAKYGEQIVTILPLIVIGVLRLDGKKFVSGAFIVTAMWLFILSTLGRTNLILCLIEIAVIVFLLLAFKRFRKYLRKIVVILAIAAISTLLIHSPALLAEKPVVPIVARVSDDEGMSYTNNFRKLMTSISLEMFRAHPVIGVGADNYGILFNEYRVIYADKNPTDINLKVAENEIAERSHNEYLQILSELGIIGGLIFLIFLSSIGIMSLQALRNFRKLSLFPLAALLGAGMFLASSLVSSFSFRLIQHGFIFFFVLAVAAKFLLKDKPDSEKIIVPANYLRLGYSAGIIMCLLLTVYCGMRAASVYYAHKIGELDNLEQAMPLYEKAFWLDDLNPDARVDLGINLLNAKRYDEAAREFRKSIDIGRAISSGYSYLSTAQYLAGDTVAAENTFAEALRLYPLSPFVRARYAYFLQLNGKKPEAERQLEIARKLDKKQANSWWSLINDGIQPTTEKVFANKDDFAPVMDLIPGDSLAAIRAEREIRFPAEKIQYDFGN
jgi:O-antigen ligase